MVVESDAIGIGAAHIHTKKDPLFCLLLHRGAIITIKNGAALLTQRCSAQNFTYTFLMPAKEEQ